MLAAEWVNLSQLAQERCWQVPGGAAAFQTQGMNGLSRCSCGLPGFPWGCPCPRHSSSLLPIYPSQSHRQRFKSLSHLHSFPGPFPIWSSPSCLHVFSWIPSCLHQFPHWVPLPSHCSTPPTTACTSAAHLCICAARGPDPCTSFPLLKSCLMINLPLPQSLFGCAYLATQAYSSCSQHLPSKLRLQLLGRLIDGFGAIMWTVSMSDVGGVVGVRFIAFSSSSRA